MLKRKVIALIGGLAVVLSIGIAAPAGAYTLSKFVNNVFTASEVSFFSSSSGVIVGARAIVDNTNASGVRSFIRTAANGGTVRQATAFAGSTAIYSHAPVVGRAECYWYSTLTIPPSARLNCWRHVG